MNAIPPGGSAIATGRALKVERKMTDGNAVSTIRLTPADGEPRVRLPVVPAWARALDAPARPGSGLVVAVVDGGPWPRLRRGVPAPTMVPDEVVYSDLAKSIAAGGFPSVRGVHELGWGLVYQALIAPAWVVFDDPMHAYHAALIVNALLMSLAAVPAYFLARMFVSGGLQSSLRWRRCSCRRCRTRVSC